MTGSVAYPLLHQWAKGREKELETIFLAEKDQKAIGSRWLYNQKGAGGWPGDLGYWIGYRVAKSYYDRAPRSEEHTSELQSLMRISYAVFCLKKKNTTNSAER